MTLDYAKLATKLRLWFEDNEVSPDEAVPLMCTVIGIQIGWVEKNGGSADELIADVNSLIRANMARWRDVQ